MKKIGLFIICIFTISISSTGQVKVYDNAGYNTELKNLGVGDHSVSSWGKERISSIIVPDNYNCTVWAKKHGKELPKKVIKGHWTVFDPEDPYNDSIYKLSITKDQSRPKLKEKPSGEGTSEPMEDFTVIRNNEDGSKVYRANRYLCVKISTFDEDDILTSSAEVRINSGDSWLMKENQSFLICN